MSRDAGEIVHITEDSRLACGCCRRVARLVLSRGRYLCQRCARKALCRACGRLAPWVYGATMSCSRCERRIEAA